MLSDRAKKWLRNKFEKWAGSFYQGPRPPEERLRQQAVDFANMYPHATREQWVAFASGLAEEVWRSAWLQGLEWQERTDADFNPEVVMDQIDPDWRHTEAFDLNDPDQVVPDLVPEGEQQVREMRLFAQMYEQWRR